MLKSNNINDYFKIHLETLRDDIPLSFSVHLYFSHNDHIILWKRNGDMTDREFLDRNIEKGIRSLWIHRDDQEAYRIYLMREADEPVQSMKDFSLSDSEIPPLAYENADGILMAEALASDEIDDQTKKDILSAVSKDMLQELASAKSVEEHKKIQKKNNHVVHELIAQTLTESRKAAARFLELAVMEKDLEHALNVSTYTVIFSLAFGKLDPELLADLALGGLLHDLGISQVAFDVSNLPSTTQTTEQSSEYEHHVERGISYIQNFSDHIPQRVIDLISHHHEKFNGEGYPHKKRGFDLDDVSQIVALSDMIDSIGLGYWDGTPKTLSETFEILQKFEKNRSFPEYFNPEIFGQVMGWVSSPDGQNPEIDELVKVVESQIGNVIEQED